MEKRQRQEIETIYKDPKFQSIMDFAETVLRKWEQENTVGMTEFETLALGFQREFKIKGLIEFFHALFALANDKESTVEEVKQKRLEE
jgi:hypothetical protein